MNSKFIVLACLLIIVHSHVININKRNLIPEARVIGGHDAKPGEFPHRVSLQVNLNPDNYKFTHFCSGSILNEQWILTARHCLLVLQNIPPEAVFVVKAGKHDLLRLEDTEQTSVVQQFFKHENYTGTQHIPGFSDIGLIKLKTPLHLNKRVAKINLPEKDSEPNDEVIISGWGAIKNSINGSSSYPNILQTNTLPIITRKVCNEAVKSYIPPYNSISLHDDDYVDETTICTGPLTGGHGVCSGDSGGPLIEKNKNGQFEIVGIVSWSMFICGSAGAPSVYVKVSHFIDWLQNIIKNN